MDASSPVCARSAQIVLFLLDLQRSRLVEGCVLVLLLSIDALVSGTQRRIMRV